MATTWISDEDMAICERIYTSKKQLISQVGPDECNFKVVRLEEGQRYMGLYMDPPKDFPACPAVDLRLATKGHIPRLHISRADKHKFGEFIIHYRVKSSHRECYRAAFFLTEDQSIAL